MTIFMMLLGDLVEGTVEAVFDGKGGWDEGKGGWNLAETDRGKGGW